MSQNLGKNAGLAQIPLIIGLLIMAIAIPAASKLVQNNQDTRNKAAGCTVGDRTYGECCGCHMTLEVTEHTDENCNKTYSKGSCDIPNDGACGGSCSAPAPTNPPTGGGQLCNSAGQSCSDNYSEGCTVNGQSGTRLCHKTGTCNGVGGGSQCSWGAGSYCEDCGIGGVPIATPTAPAVQPTIPAGSTCATDGASCCYDYNTGNSYCDGGLSCEVVSGGLKCKANVPTATPTPSCGGLGLNCCTGDSCLGVLVCSVGKCVVGGAAPTSTGCTLGQPCIMGDGRTGTCQTGYGGYAVCDLPYANPTATACTLGQACIMGDGGNGICQTGYGGLAVCDAVVASPTPIVGGQCDAFGLFGGGSDITCSRRQIGEECWPGGCKAHCTAGGGSACSCTCDNAPTATVTPVPDAGCGWLYSDGYCQNKNSGDACTNTYFNVSGKCVKNGLGCECIAESNAPTISPTCLADGTRCYASPGAPDCNTCCNGSHENPSNFGDTRSYACGAGPAPTLVPSCTNYGGCATYADTCCSGSKHFSFSCIPPIACDSAPAQPSVTPTSCGGVGKSCCSDAGVRSCDAGLTCNGSGVCQAPVPTVDTRPHYGCNMVTGQCGLDEFGPYTLYDQCRSNCHVGDCPVCNVGAERSCTLAAGQNGKQACVDLGVAGSNRNCGAWGDCYPNVHYSCNTATGNCEVDSQGRYLDQAQCNSGCAVSNVPHYKCNPATHSCSQDSTGPYTLEAQCTNNCGGQTVTPPPVVAPPVSTPTNPPGSNPTNPPSGGGGCTSNCGLGCSYQSLQARVQKDINTDWTQSLDAIAGDKINIGCMHDGTGQFADNVKLIINGVEINDHVATGYVIPASGQLNVSCVSTANNCSLSSGGDGATINAGSSSCKECPSTFQCYKNGDSYKWFAEGYAMQGYSKTTTDDDCVSRNIVKPTFKGKKQGDANCDGVIDIYDQSVWAQEFNSTRGVDMVKTNWEADFNCDGKVNIYDLPIWNQFYKGGNQQ